MFHRGCASQDLWWATTSPPPCRPTVFRFDSARVSCNRPFIRAASLQDFTRIAKRHSHTDRSSPRLQEKRGERLQQKHNNIGTLLYFRYLIWLINILGCPILDLFNLFFTDCTMVHHIALPFLGICLELFPIISNKSKIFNDLAH